MGQEAPLIDALLRRLGIDEPEPDERGVHTLYIDDELPVFLRPSSAGDALVLHAGLGAMADADPGIVGRALLGGTVIDMDRNGFSLGMVPGTDLVVLVARQPLAGLEEDAAFALFDRFAAAAVAWREAFAALIANAAKPDAGISEPADHDLPNFV